MKIPRPTGGSRQSNGVGKIFVKFDTSESAGKALRALAGRKFADRTVVATYFSEVLSSFLFYENLSNFIIRKTLKSRLGKLARFRGQTCKIATLGGTYLADMEPLLKPSNSYLYF